jgi:hypothetical protein
VTAARTLKSIAVTPANPSLPKGETQQFTAIGTYSDNTTQNLTSQVTWASATHSAATISATGLATAVATGTSRISATLGSITGSTALTVIAAVLKSIAITPANPNLPKGETQQFVATGTYSDKTTQNLTSKVTWASATHSVATISATGLATAVAKGASRISATLANISVSTVLTVTAAVLKSIAVAPVNPSVAKGLKEQFTATGTYSDGSTANVTSLVTWASATTSVATIANTAGSHGLATTLAMGTTAITASLGGIKSPSDTLKVTAAVLESIMVTPVNTSLATGETEQFTAIGILSDNTTENLTNMVTWRSSDPTWATISAMGLASAVSPGVVMISAVFDGITGTTMLTVTGY